LIKKEVLKQKPEETKLGFSLHSLKDKINEIINKIASISILNILDVAWYDARKYATDSLRRKNGLMRAVNKIGSKDRTILITNQQNIPHSITVPANITLQFLQGGFLNISSGKTVTINGHVGAGLYQIFKGSGTVSGLKKVYSEWWGTKKDGTDDSIAFQKALVCAIGGEVLISDGTYLVNCYSLDTSIRGSGKESILKSYTADGYALELGGGGTWTFRGIRDLRIDGDSGRYGVKFANQGSSDQSAGRWVFEKARFRNCKIAVHKTAGNLGNRFLNCLFEAGEFGLYAESHTDHVMHAGCDTFEGCHFQEYTLAAVYINNTDGNPGQTVFRDCIVETNAGFAFFIKEYPNLMPIVFDTVWLEQNHTSGTVTIDSVEYTPRDFYFRKTRYATLDKIGGNAYTLELTESKIRESNSFVSVGSTVIKNDTISTFISDNLQIGVQVLPTRYVESLKSVVVCQQTYANVLLIPPRNKLTSGYTAFGQTFAAANTYIFTCTDGNLTGTIINDGVLFDSCVEVTIPSNYTASVYSSEKPTLPTDKWYAWSVDVKLITTAKPSDLDFVESQVFAPNFASYLEKDKWLTFGGVTNTTAQCKMAIRAKVDGSEVTLRFSAWQTVQFDTVEEATRYFNSKLFSQTSERRRILQSDSAPTTGTWAVGDEVLNNTPAAGGTPGWVCTTAGTPGTWKAMANLAA